MKKIINLLIFFIAFNCLSAQEYPRVTIETDIFTSIFDESYQQPVMVKYTVFCNPSSPTYERDGISFKAYPGLKASSSSDYKANVYDKGHMAPANTFACKKDWLIQTFSYANCALQHQGLNRGTWAALERFERNLAKYHSMKYCVVTSNCTTALHLSLKALNIKKGDEVICPALTFIAPANMIALSGASLVLVDVDKET